jgi:hypothetical protein
LADKPLNVLNFRWGDRPLFTVNQGIIRIFPLQAGEYTSTNANARTIMIAERGVDSIRRAARAASSLTAKAA